MTRQAQHVARKAGASDGGAEPIGRRSALYAACLLAGALSLLPSRTGTPANVEAAAAVVQASGGSELRFCLRGEPRTFDPMLVEDDPSETVRYLTGGVLIRMNRATQQLEPELAESWSLSQGGRLISFHLRHGVYFSDGSPFSAEDVAFTLRKLLDPALHSPVADGFTANGSRISTSVVAPHQINISFSKPIAGVERLFDEVVILSSRSKLGSKAVLGPFYVADYRAGSFVLLKRNPNYWKRDAAGRRLPYLESVRLEIQSNRGLEALRFTRGEVQLINSVDPQFFDRLPAAAVHDIGPSLDPEMMWFNQVPTAPVSAYKRAWFRSRNFRRAVLTAIDRDAICRVVYGGHARPAIGPISPANEFWFNQKLKPLNFDRSGALALLAQDGFHLSGGILHDAQAHEVEFSLITNAGNEPRARMAAMIQQDLAAIGIHVNVVTLDFASLIDRITRSFDYESCLLGPINSDLDPNAQMNEWLSSAPNHQWNPSQKTPASPWEAEIDRLMRLQASTTDRKSRKAAFDRVQQIAWDEAPFLSLVNKDALCAISPNVQSAQPVVLRPQTYWNIEHLSLGAQLALK